MKRQTQAFSLVDYKCSKAIKARAIYGFMVSVLLLCTLSLMQSCTQTRPQADPQQQPGQTETYQNPAAQPLDNQTGDIGQNEILAAQNNRAEKVELTFSAPVMKLLPDDTRGLPHQRFLLQLNNGSTILVAHDTKYAPKVPIQPGDTVTIKGEFIWNRKGGVVHWTHHSDTPRHESGYIEFGGKRYE